MLNDFLENKSEMLIKIRFRSKIHGNPEFKYLLLEMTYDPNFEPANDVVEKPFIYKLKPDLKLYTEMKCEEFYDENLKEIYYEYTAIFHPFTEAVINKFGGCYNFIDSISMIPENGFYIREDDTIYKDAQFIDISFEFDGKIIKVFFS